MLPRLRAVTVAAAILVSGCHHHPPDVRMAVQRGLADLASSYDGNHFDDPYLDYVYPGESLASPLPGYRVTYRMLDAYFITVMLRRTGIDAGPAARLFDRADTLTAALVPRWRELGIYNLRRHPAPNGIALDTYAILAWLRRDLPMARVVQAGYDGDGWLAANQYTGSQAFRTQADESWAVRCCVAVGLEPDRVRPMLEDLCADTRAALARQRDAVGQANLLIHALAAIADAADCGVVPAGDAGLVPRCRAEWTRAAVALLRDPAVRASTVTLANLLEVLARVEPSSFESLQPAVREILGRQEASGGWRPARDTRDDSGRTFTTLRCLLALTRYQQLLHRATKPPPGAARVAHAVGDRGADRPRASP